MIRSNLARAMEGLALCQKLESLTGVDTLDDQVSDALAQLMHMCRLMRNENGEIVDFDEALVRARRNFQYEVENDPDDTKETDQ